MMAENLRILAENLGDPKLVDKLKTTNVVGPTASAQATNSPKQMKPLLEVKDLACGYQASLSLHM